MTQYTERLSEAGFLSGVSNRESRFEGEECMKKKGYLLVLLFLLLFVTAAPVKADAAWKHVDGKYYYYNSQGELYTKRRVGQYYVGKDGARVKNKWVGKYFYAENGKRISNFKGGWLDIKGRRYYYTKKGKKVTGWLKLGAKKYYFDEEGVMKRGWQNIGKYRYFFSSNKRTYGVMLKGWQNISRRRFYFAKNSGRLQQGWFTLSGSRYYCSPTQGIATGVEEIGGKRYLFNTKGVLQYGWKTYNGNRYYATKANEGALAVGMGTISGKIYYFDANGVLQKNTTVTVNGQAYSINSSGVCTPVTTSSGVSEDMLFFTLYESGLEGYGQVGGDYGNACGKYQFDRRYSLINFVKYCYARDPIIFAGFEPYASYSQTNTKHQNKMKSNTKFYKVWTDIYNTYPVLFKNYQDAFALQEYYEPTESLLRVYGVDISSRPYVVKGAVFSYSIQHGSGTAAQAVLNAKITNQTSDADFIKKLYKYRIKKFPAYKSRYTREMNDALSRL